MAVCSTFYSLTDDFQAAIAGTALFSGLVLVVGAVTINAHRAAEMSERVAQP